MKDEKDDQDYASWERDRVRKAQEDNRGDIRCIRIEPAENGFTAITEYEPKPRSGRKNDICCSPWPEPDKSVFTSLAELNAHISKSFGGAK